MNIRKFLSMFLLVCIVILLLPFTNIVSSAATGYWTDSGNMASSFSSTGTNTITITNEGELALLASNVNNGVNTYSGYTIYLSKDLDLSAHQWVAIGTSATYKFAGVFDGCRFLIDGIYINNTASNQGLFGYAIGATIKNVGVEGSISSTTSYVGGILGYGGTATKIYNCYANVNLTGVSYIGGIAGLVGGSSIINNCISSGTISGSTYCGGIAGGVSKSTVAYNYWLYGTATNACGSGAATYSYTFNSNNTVCTLNNSVTYTIGTTTILVNGDLLTALLAWVDTNGTATYKSWRNADSTTENNGCPVFQEIYNVTINWINAACTCTETWDTETCEFTYLWVNNPLSMSIYNSSDDIIKASFTYLPNETGAGTIGTFHHGYYGNFTFINIAKNTEVSNISLNLSGTSTADNIAWDNTTIGTATITITKGGN